MHHYLYVHVTDREIEMSYVEEKDSAGLIKCKQIDE